ncbi:2'-5' RNA ligase [Chitinispirillum alkaliphilum]|nr:2'-5' RNA ligase [Chitinispirillum alkaliphilum]
MSRLFVAIDLPENIKEKITSTYLAIPSAKWIDKDQLHLTLRFIGETSRETAESLDSCLRGIDFPPISLTMKGVGFFPPRKQPRILWCGIAENEQLMRFQNKIERAVSASGISPDNRKFHPHITVARLKNSPPERVADYMAMNSLFETEQFTVSEFHLYSSHLSREGSHHTREVTYSLEDRNNI